MNDLKTVRDALDFVEQNISALETMANGAYEAMHNGFPDETGVMIEYSRELEQWKSIRAILSRMIETPALQGCVDDQPKCTWDFYRSTLERFVYETTHLSAENADGSHDCKISKKCLLHGRIALELLGKLSATPTPTPICKSCTNGMSYGVDGEYPCPKCHGNNAPTEKVERIEGVFPCPFEWFTRRVNAIRHKDEGLTFYMSPKEIERVNEAYRAYLKQKSGYTEKVDFNIVLDNEDKLLPCPFCGEPIIHTESDDPQFYFECSDKVHCGIRFNIYADSEKTAFDCMNNRAPIGDKNEKTIRND